MQNEILQLLGNSIVRGIAQTIQALPVMQYSIVIDGTQDICGVEQESIIIRYVDQDQVPHEVFVGLYEVSSSTGEAMARMAKDVLLRLNLPIAYLRGQTYDGAANMSGKHSGVSVKHNMDLITVASSFGDHKCQSNSKVMQCLEGGSSVLRRPFSPMP